MKRLWAPKCLTLITLIMLLGSIAWANPSTPLKPEDAFRFHVKTDTPERVIVTLKLGKQVFLYPETISWTTANPKAPQPQIDTVHPPEQDPKQWGQWVRWIIQSKPETPHPQALTLHYQGCSAKGYCYAPRAHTVQLANNLSHAGLEDQRDPLINIASTQAADKALPGTFSWQTMGMYFMLGIMMIVSPCVWPLLPILWANTLKENQQQQGKSWLILAFLSGVVLSYAGLGLVFGHMGQLLSTQLQSPQWSGIMALILLLMAGVTVDKIRWPFSGSTISGATLPQARGPWRYLRLMLIGGSSSLILSPCATPALLSGLILTAKQGLATSGIIYLTSMGVGVACPMGIMGCLGQRFSLKSGPWLIGIKHLLAWLLCALAAYLLLPWVTPFFSGLLIALVLGLWLMALATTLRLSDTRWTQKIALMVVYLVLLGIIAEHSGWRDKLNHAAHSKQAQGTITQVKALNEALAEAKATQQKTLIDFSAAWCATCHTLESRLWSQSRVQQALKGMRWLRVDITQPNAAMHTWMGHHGLIAPPAFLLIDPQHTPSILWAHTGWIETNAFLGQLKQHATY